MKIVHLETTRQLISPKRASRVGGQLFGVLLQILNLIQILILKQHQSFQIFQISINFRILWEKLFIPKYTQKSSQNLQNYLKHRYEMSGEILDSLKRELDICVRLVIPTEPKYGLQVESRLKTWSQTSMANARLNAGACFSVHS